MGLRREDQELVIEQMLFVVKSKMAFYCIVG